MPWWGCVLIGVALYVGTVETLRYRGFKRDRTSNSSRPVREGQKKAPDQAEAESGVEYGGTHLP